MNWIEIEKEGIPDIGPDRAEQCIVNSRRNGIDVVICAVLYKGKFWMIEQWETGDPEELEFVSHYMMLPLPPGKHVNGLHFKFDQSLN